MTGKRYRLHILRTVKESIGRFLAILGIVMLGVGFMAGMLSVAPDMRLSADNYFDNANFYDIRVVGTLGISKEDILSIRKISGVKGVMPCYTSDVGLSSETGITKVTRISTLPFDLMFKENESYINQIELISGKMPEKANEAVYVVRKMSEAVYNIGDVLTFTDENNDYSDTFTQTSFTVVGIVKSPYYFSIDKESTNIGSGTVDVNLFVREESFCAEAYTEAYVTVDGARELSAFSKKYGETVAEIAQNISDISSLRCETRKDVLTKQIESARTELDSKKNELLEAKEQLDYAEEQITLLEETLPAQEELLNEGKKEYEAGLALFEEEMSAAKEELNTAKSTINSLSLMIKAADGMIADAKAELELMRGEGNEEIANVLQTQLDNLLTYYDGLMTEYDALVAEYEEGLAQYKSAKAEAEAELKEGKAMLDLSEKQLNEAKEQLAAAKEEYASGKAEYEKRSEEAAPLIEEAEARIKESEELLESVGDPEWYVFERNEYVSFSGFADNADRIDAIGKVFPVFFFLVAALVVVTTMTRMIDEERIQIGTLKALGYSKNAIAAKYVIYSEIATVAGSILGLAVGITFLPSVMWDTYGMMYDLGKVYIPFYPSYCLITAGVAALVTFISTISATRYALSEHPAALMLPKAPKAGKKILLERIGFIWKRMPFISKVTARNIFRYKKRFFMTVTGIAGCAALLLAGFGIRDSISDIVDKQFTQIHRYDTVVALKNTDSIEEIKSYLDSNVSSYTLNFQSTVTLKTDAGEHEDTLYVTCDKDKITEFITLRDRKTKKPVTLEDKGAVITEKSAKALGISAGDSVSLTVNGVTSEIEITGIVENYVQGYLYITESHFEEKFGELEKYNAITVMLKDEADRNRISTELLRNDSVAQVVSISDIRESVSEMLDKINMVVWVLIVSAGLLAFVVLYNLINININERRREIATLKVLGFRKGETSAYIFRETSILAIIGTAIGLFLGIFLWMFVIKTAEVDMVMFGREIYPFSFIIAAILTFVFAAFVFVAMMPKIKKIDMVESLKSAE